MSWTRFFPDAAIAASDIHGRRRACGLRDVPRAAGIPSLIEVMPVGAPLMRDRQRDDPRDRPGGPTAESAAGPGKRTLIESLPTQRLSSRSKTTEPAARDNGDVSAIARRGTEGGGGQLPHLSKIQTMFGRHDVSSVQAHTGAEADASAQAIGADAYATGNHVVLGRNTDLHTVAHEAAHVVQQRGGVQLKGGVGEAGDAYECHADAVADRVVAGRSAEDLLEGGSGRSEAVVQRRETADDAKLLENQANLKGTDVEIPALEGALLSTRRRRSSAAFCRRHRSTPASRCHRP